MTEESVVEDGSHHDMHRAHYIQQQQEQETQPQGQAARSPTASQLSLSSLLTISVTTDQDVPIIHKKKKMGDRRFDDEAYHEDDLVLEDVQAVEGNRRHPPPADRGSSSTTFNSYRNPPASILSPAAVTTSSSSSVSASSSPARLAHLISSVDAANSSSALVAQDAKRMLMQARQRAMAGGSSLNGARHPGMDVDSVMTEAVLREEVEEAAVIDSLAVGESLPASEAAEWAQAVGSWRPWVKSETNPVVLHHAKPANADEKKKAWDEPPKAGAPIPLSLLLDELAKAIRTAAVEKCDYQFRHEDVFSVSPLYIEQVLLSVGIAPSGLLPAPPSRYLDMSSSLNNVPAIWDGRRHYSTASSLPHEILSLIFTFVDANSTLAACALTCRWWSDVAIACLWEDIALSSEMEMARFVRSAIYSAALANRPLFFLHEIASQMPPFLPPPVFTEGQTADAPPAQTALKSASMGIYQTFLTLTGLARPPPAFEGEHSAETVTPGASSSKSKLTIPNEKAPWKSMTLSAEGVEGALRKWIDEATQARLIGLPQHLRPSFLFLRQHPSALGMNGQPGTPHASLPVETSETIVGLGEQSAEAVNAEWLRALFQARGVGDEGANGDVAAYVGRRMSGSSSRKKENVFEMFGGLAKDDDGQEVGLGLGHLVRRLSVPTFEAQVPFLGILNSLMPNLQCLRFHHIHNEDTPKTPLTPYLLSTLSPLIGSIDSLVLEDANEPCWGDLCLTLQTWGGKLRSLNVEAMGNMDAFDSTEDLEPVFPCLENLEFLRLDGIPIGTNSAVMALANSCKMMKVLTLDYCLEITMGTLPIVWNGCPSLSFLGLAGIVGDQALPCRLGTHKNLRTLRLVDCDVCDGLFIEVAARAPGLEMIRIVFEDDHCEGIVAVSSELSDQSLLAFVPQPGASGVRTTGTLTTLALTRCPNMTASALSRVLDTNPVKVLDLHKDPECTLGGLDDNFILEIADHMKNVRVLHLFGQTALTDEALCRFFSHPATKNLTSVCLNNTKVTLPTLQKLMAHCETLEALSVIECPLLSVGDLRAVVEPVVLRGKEGFSKRPSRLERFYTGLDLRKDPSTLPAPPSVPSEEADSDLLMNGNVGNPPPPVIPNFLSMIPVSIQPIQPVQAPNPGQGSTSSNIGFMQADASLPFVNNPQGMAGPSTAPHLTVAAWPDGEVQVTLPHDTGVHLTTVEALEDVVVSSLTGFSTHSIDDDEIAAEEAPAGLVEGSPLALAPPPADGQKGPKAWTSIVTDMFYHVPPVVAPSASASGSGEVAEPALAAVSVGEMENNWPRPPPATFSTIGSQERSPFAVKTVVVASRPEMGRDGATAEWSAPRGGAVDEDDDDDDEEAESAEDEDDVRGESSTNEEADVAVQEEVAALAGEEEGGTEDEDPEEGEEGEEELTVFADAVDQQWEAANSTPGRTAFFESSSSVGFDVQVSPVTWVEAQQLISPSVSDARGDTALMETGNTSVDEVAEAVPVVEGEGSQVVDAPYVVPYFVRDEDRWFVDEGLDILSLWEGAVRQNCGSGSRWLLS